MSVFILLLDNSQYYAVDPGKLILNNVGPYRTQLGYPITVPVLDENKQPVLNEDKTPKTEVRFQSLMEFKVQIVEEPKAPAQEATPATPASAPAPVAKKAKKRKR